MKFLKAIANVGLMMVLAGCQAPGPETSTTSTGAIPSASVGLTPANASPDPVYANLPLNKAQALSHALTGTGVEYTNNVASQPSPVAAALRALSDCEQARAARDTASSACEIRRKDDVVIHSTAELTSGLAADRPALLWRLSAANAPTANVYIAGSIHVLKPTLQAPPSYTQALAESDTLVFEIDETLLSAEQMQSLIQRYGNLPNEQTLAELMSAADYANIIEYTSRLGVPEALISRMNPAMLLLQVGVLEYISMGYLPQHGVESVFRAKKGTRNLIALETMEQQLAAATALPLRLQTELLLETIAAIDTANLEISELVGAWLAGDAQHLDALFNGNADASPAAKQWMDDLLAKRNIGMAAGVIELLQSTEDHFVLVGAAHLVGENSVIALLEQQGVTATRLRHNSLTPAIP